LYQHSVKVKMRIHRRKHAQFLIDP